ncbi:ester cyclase [Streptomyces sp. NPDC055105]|uniref:ester cyclase n=1 Tax=Streptomyces sp. NPDC055105 TaxID=3365719 RepID=UPI0037CED436
MCPITSGVETWAAGGIRDPGKRENRVRVLPCGRCATGPPEHRDAARIPAAVRGRQRRLHRRRSPLRGLPRRPTRAREHHRSADRGQRHRRTQLQSDQLGKIDALKQATRSLRGAFGDWRHHDHQLIADGDLVSRHWQVSGRHSGDFFGIPATGRSFTFT